MTNDDPMYVKHLERGLDAAEEEIKSLENEIAEQRSQIGDLLEQLNPTHMGEPMITRPKVGAGDAALEVHGTVFFKGNHQYRSQLRFPIADGAYELVKIEKERKRHGTNRLYWADLKDAARYRWLRTSDYDIFGSPHAVDLSGEDLDEAIDSAMMGANA